jgi:hypothetical protein
MTWTGGATMLKPLILAADLRPRGPNLEILAQWLVQFKDAPKLADRFGVFVDAQIHPRIGVGRVDKKA